MLHRSARHRLWEELLVASPAGEASWDTLGNLQSLHGALLRKSPMEKSSQLLRIMGCFIWPRVWWSPCHFQAQGSYCTNDPDNSIIPIYSWVHRIAKGSLMQLHLVLSPPTWSFSRYLRLACLEWPSHHWIYSIDPYHSTDLNLVWYPTRNLFLWSGSLAKSDASRTWHNDIMSLPFILPCWFLEFRGMLTPAAIFLPVGGPFINDLSMVNIGFVP